MQDYQNQATDFLEATDTQMTINFLENNYHFSGDKEKRDIYEVTIKRGGRKFKLKFGNSLNNSGFYIKQGVRKTNIPREALAFSDQKIKSLGYQYGFLPTTRLDTIHRPTTPDAYSILSCLTKYDPGTFEDFCSEFGYDTDSRAAKKTYKAVCKEWMNVTSIWTDSEIEQLSEIQ